MLPARDFVSSVSLPVPCSRHLAIVELGVSEREPKLIQKKAFGATSLFFQSQRLHAEGRE
jgi:hypothetical protein